MSKQNPAKSVDAVKVLVRSDVEGKEALSEMEADMEIMRPRVRADCLPGGINELRPCPWYRCEAHLGLEINPDTGSIQVRDIDTMVHTCTFDVADIGGVTLDEIGEIMDLTRERIRQIEVRALVVYKPVAIRLGLAPDGHDRESSMLTVAKFKVSQDRLEKQLADDADQD